jgi:hypothetical protein
MTDSSNSSNSSSRTRRKKWVCHVFQSSACSLCSSTSLPLPFPPGDALLSKRELGPGSELFTQLACDPLDSRQLVACGSSGGLAVLSLNDPAGDKLAMQQYRVNSQAQQGIGG